MTGELTIRELRRVLREARGGRVYILTNVAGHDHYLTTMSSRSEVLDLTRDFPREATVQVQNEEVDGRPVFWIGP